MCQIQEKHWKYLCGFLGINLNLKSKIMRSFKDVGYRNCGLFSKQTATVDEQENKGFNWSISCFAFVKNEEYRFHMLFTWGSGML